MKTGSVLAIIVFVAVALGHLLRLVYAAEVTVAGTSIPQWASVAGVIIPVLIAFLLWKESKA